MQISIYRRQKMKERLERQSPDVEMAPLHGANILALFPNHTWQRAKSDEDGVRRWRSLTIALPASYNRHSACQILTTDSLPCSNSKP